MASGDIVLIIVSGLGVVHGLALALYSWVYTRGLRLANRLLSVLLLVLSFRVGKSVFLVFAEDIDVKLIFVGLGTLMAIGPLYHLFVRACLHKWKSLHRKELIQFIPAVVGVCFGLWLDDSHIQTIPKWVFAVIFLSYYLHLLLYLGSSYLLIRRSSAVLPADVKRLLQLFLYGLLVIWIAYVLNLFDDLIPYVAGPVLYSFVAYAISFEVIRKGYLDKVEQAKYKTTHANDQQVEEAYDRVLEIIHGEQAYKNPDITLQSLSDRLRLSSQLLSMAINQKSGKNFNQFINTFRVNEAAKLFEQADHQHQTIAAIAFHSGFNSISSFNTAFKKEFGMTPKQFRSQLPK